MSIPIPYISSHEHQTKYMTTPDNEYALNRKQGSFNQIRNKLVRKIIKPIMQVEPQQIYFDNNIKQNHMGGHNGENNIVYSHNNNSIGNVNQRYNSTTSNVMNNQIKSHLNANKQNQKSQQKNIQTDNANSLLYSRSAIGLNKQQKNIKHSAKNHLKYPPRPRSSSHASLSAQKPRKNRNISIQNNLVMKNASSDIKKQNNPLQLQITNRISQTSNHRQTLSNQQHKNPQHKPQYKNTTNLQQKNTINQNQTHEYGVNYCLYHYKVGDDVNIDFQYKQYPSANNLKGITQQQQSLIVNAKQKSDQMKEDQNHYSLVTSLTRLGKNINNQNKDNSNQNKIYQPQYGTEEKNNNKIGNGLVMQQSKSLSRLSEIGNRIPNCDRLNNKGSKKLFSYPYNLGTKKAQNRKSFDKQNVLTIQQTYFSVQSHTGVSPIIQKHLSQRPNRSLSYNSYGTRRPCQKNQLPLQMLSTNENKNIKQFKPIPEQSNLKAALSYKQLNNMKKCNKDNNQNDKDNKMKNVIQKVYEQPIIQDNQRIQKASNSNNFDKKKQQKKRSNDTFHPNLSHSEARVNKLSILYLMDKMHLANNVLGFIQSIATINDSIYCFKSQMQLLNQIQQSSDIYDVCFVLIEQIVKKEQMKRIVQKYPWCYFVIDTENSISKERETVNMNEYFTGQRIQFPIQQKEINTEFGYRISLKNNTIEISNFQHFHDAVDDILLMKSSRFDVNKQQNQLGQNLNLNANRFK